MTDRESGLPTLDRQRLRVWGDMLEHIDWQRECWLCGEVEIHDAFVPMEEGWIGYSCSDGDFFWLCPSCARSNP